MIWRRHWQRPAHLHADPVNDGDTGIVASPPVRILACGSLLMRMMAPVDKDVTTAPRLMRRVGEKPRAPDHWVSLCSLLTVIN